MIFKFLISTNLAPENCLQYFTDLKGSFQSFGYNHLNPNISTYNINETYAICFKRHAEACGIRYCYYCNCNSRSVHLYYNFSYTVNQFQVGSAAGTGTTPTDFLYIPAVRPTGTLQDERLSGLIDPNMHFMCKFFFKSNVSIFWTALLFSAITPGPFYVFFQSDSLNGGSNSEIGFDIKYEIATSCP